MPAVSAKRFDSSQTAPALFAIFLLAVFAGGGASRLDVLSQPVVWLIAIASLAVTLAFTPRAALATQKTLLAFLALCTLLVAIQLIPLPPGLWTALPGRAVFADMAAAAGIAQPWRPINLTPDLGWASLLGMLPPLAFVAGYATLGEAQRKWLLPVLLGAALLSALLGLAQLSAGPGLLRFYQVTNAESAVGLFANRNHQAVFLVIALPMLAAWARLAAGTQQAMRVRAAVALVAGLLILPMILATGSRAGALLVFVGLGGVVALLLGKRDALFSPRVYQQRGGLLKWLGIASAAAVVVATIVVARSPAMDRLFASTPAEEQRGQLLDPLLEMVRAFFPFGSGFGSFDAVFRVYEPTELLTQTYMNQAHNDLAQLAIEGGIGGLALLAALLFWMVKRSLLHWSPAQRLSSARLMGRLGSLVMFVILIASLADYPLRTPFMALVFLTGALWLAADPVADRDRERSRG